MGREALEKCFSDMHMAGYCLQGQLVLEVVQKCPVGITALLWWSSLPVQQEPQSPQPYLTVVEDTIRHSVFSCGAEN